MLMYIHDACLVVSLLALCVALWRRSPLKRRKVRKLLKQIRGA